MKTNFTESKFVLALRHCAECGQVFGFIDLFCEPCWQELMDHLDPHWRREGAGFPVFCLWSWDESSPRILSTLLKAFKGGRHPQAAIRLAKPIVLLQKRLMGTKSALITPIPNISGKLDHAEILARALSNVSQVEFVTTKIRKQKGLKQKRKSKKERRHIQFESGPDIRVPAGTTLFIVDDVITTGATLNAFRANFKNFESVAGLCLVDRLC